MNSGISSRSAVIPVGVGLLKTLDFFTRQHLPARFGALIAILFGLWMLKDFFLPDLDRRLQAPTRVGEIARQSAKKATIPALIVGGMFGFGLLMMLIFLGLPILLVVAVVAVMAGLLGRRAGPMSVPSISGSAAPATLSARYCSRCGQGLQADWTHCPKCGAPLEGR